MNIEWFATYLCILVLFKIEDCTVYAFCTWNWSLACAKNAIKVVLQISIIEVEISMTLRTFFCAILFSLNVHKISFLS
jgi:hypothetical protein